MNDIHVGEYAESYIGLDIKACMIFLFYFITHIAFNILVIFLG